MTDNEVKNDLLKLKIVTGYTIHLIAQPLMSVVKTWSSILNSCMVEI